MASFDFGVNSAELSDAQRPHLKEIPFVPLTNLRINSALPAAQKAIRQAAGLDLPRVPNTISRGPYCIAMWLGPDEWLLRWHGTEPDRAAMLAHALSGTFHAINELGNGYSVLELSGPRAREVLNKGCPLDLHPRSFGPEQCAQSLYFKASVLLRCLGTGAEDAWEIIVRRSFADYTAHMLVDAMQEYGADL